jgi:hypothetical protein
MDPPVHVPPDQVSVKGTEFPAVVAYSPDAMHHDAVAHVIHVKKEKSPVAAGCVGMGAACGVHVVPDRDSTNAVVWPELFS